MQATLILENGARFVGESAGSEETRVCEMVFNTSMTGYQEILTDPTYAGQGVVMTYPLVGNYGVNEEDAESARPWAEVLVVRQLAHRGSNFRCQKDISSYLRENRVSALCGVDTRALTRMLCGGGAMNAMLTTEPIPAEEALARIRAHRVSGRVEAVTCKEPRTYDGSGARIALLDFGAKNSLIRSLRRLGCSVTVFPAHTPAEEILRGGFRGVLLSNGPGDPADCVEIVNGLKTLYASGLPIFAIGLGHQLLALAAGAGTEKLRQGHRGGNHPVRDLATGRVLITAQNHGYVVTAASVSPALARVSHVNINDGTVEGLEYTARPAFSVQFHPEPADTARLFARFIAMTGGASNA